MSRSRTIKEATSNKAVDEMISQPIEGLLYDLNMLPEVLCTHRRGNTKEWLIMRIIQRLHTKAYPNLTGDNK